MLNKKGFTLVEVMIATTLSIAVLVSFLQAPQRVMHSFRGYINETDIYKTNDHISLAIHQDLNQFFYLTEREDGFEIGPSVYTFTEEGLKRTYKASTSVLSEEPVQYSIVDNRLIIKSATEEDSEWPSTHLVFSLNTTPLKGGGAF